MMKRSLYLILAVLVCSLYGCGGKKELSCSGSTMGTSYHVKVVTTSFRSTESLQARIDKKLQEINRSMSTFDADSEISRFNAMTAVGEALSISEDFYDVMETATYLNDITGGAWDGTVMPLVDLWGFGPAGFSGVVPAPEEIDRCLGRVGFSSILLGEGRATLSKTRSEVTLDLASIAKGYGVDVLAELLKELGCRDFLVEVGGEVYAQGVRVDGKPWRVGINRPQADASFTDVYHVLTLSGRALATSGDYRNFFEMAGQHYSHIINPKTGYPVANGVVSVSVLADSCMLADGLATAMMVMGVDGGISLADTLPNISCLIVVQNEDGSLTDYSSEGFILDE